MHKSDAKKLTKLVAGNMNADKNTKTTKATATKKSDAMTVRKPKY